MVNGLHGRVGEDGSAVAGVRPVGGNPEEHIQGQIAAGIRRPVRPDLLNPERIRKMGEQNLRGKSILLRRVLAGNRGNASEHLRPVPGDRETGGETPAAARGEGERELRYGVGGVP
ncbi:unnamed protein product [Cuscuta epithymum]|uniref:Uncharacterized protein n=1 Tax=Cuscuta epithymum TaxID=186058 RepID=A0AAV0EKN4_9ASTE|nr:unnamed protein product [Cuscuta epithymum]